MLVRGARTPEHAEWLHYNHYPAQSQVTSTELGLCTLLDDITLMPMCSSEQGRGDVNIRGRGGCCDTRASDTRWVPALALALPQLVAHVRGQRWGNGEIMIPQHARHP